MMLKLIIFYIVGMKNFENDLIELYLPKKIMLEKPLLKNPNLKTKEYNVLSNNYSKKKVVQLKSSYEKEKSITYDLVILTRFDIIILNPLNYKKIDKTKFYVVGPKKHHSNNCKCLFCDDSLPNHCLNDVLFISSSKNMDKFSLAYDYLNEYGLKSNHIIAKKHLLKSGLWKNIDYVYNCKTNKYSQIWNVLETIGLFPKNMVPARIYDTDVPLIRWVYKSYYLKILDFVIFKLKTDIFFYYLFWRPYNFIKNIPFHLRKIK